jgi:hypothetical protein
MFHRRNLKAFVYLALLFLLLSAIPGESAKASGTQTGGFTLLSAGKDGVIGTDDDIYVTGKGEVVKGAVDLAALGLTQADLVPSSGPKEEFAFVPASIVVVADKESAPADGSTPITITAEVRGQDGSLAPDGTEVAFSATAGRLSSGVASTSGGLASVSIVSSQPGEVTVTASAGNVFSAVEVAFSEVGISARYLVVEIYDHYYSNCATITEIEVYDRSARRISYSIGQAYDSATGTYPAYWFRSPYTGQVVWDRTNLYDGDTRYVDTSSGEQSTTSFLYPSNPNTGQWARFVLDLGAERDIGLVKIAAGSPEGRIPHYIEVYAGAAYSYEASVKSRSNEGLALVGRVEPQPTQTSVRWFEIRLP